MQSLTGKDRAALKQIVETAAQAVADQEAAIEKLKQSGGKASKRMGSDLTHARRALRKQQKAAARLAKRLGKVLDTVDGM
jgi:ABC-type transporter Mla subunit MlaD